MAPNLTNLPDVPINSTPLQKRKLTWIWLLPILGLLVLLVLLGVGLFRVEHPILSIGSEVPDFTLKLFDDYQYQDADHVSLAALRGKVVVVNFWASWCLTCVDEAVVMEAAWRYYQPNGQVVFLGVDYTDVDSKALEFLSKFQVSYPNGPDLGTRITPIFNRNIAMPETYIVDQQGFLRHEQIGPFQSIDEIRSAIDPLLGRR